MKILIKMIYGASIFLEQNYYNVSLFVAATSNKAPWSNYLFEDKNNICLMLYYTEYDKINIVTHFSTIYIIHKNSVVYSIENKIKFFEEYCDTLKLVKEFYPNEITLNVV